MNMNSDKEEMTGDLNVFMFSQIVGYIKTSVDIIDHAHVYLVGLKDIMNTLKRENLSK